jgi:hypothetical protein
MAFVVKIRGARGVMLAEYDCPEHGRHEELVQRDESGDPPEFANCTLLSRGVECDWSSELVLSAATIHRPAFVSANRGKNDPKPFPEAMDTEPLADGKVTLQEWKKQRAEMWHASDYAEFKSKI